MQKNNLEQLLKKLRNFDQLNPSDDFRKNAKLRLLDKISAPKVNRKHLMFNKTFHFAALSLGIFLLAGGGTVLAAQKALPSDILYPVKTASEQLILAATPKDYKAKVVLEVTDRRAEELKKLNNLGKSDELQPAAIHYEQSVKLLNKVNNSSDSKEKKDVEEHLSNNARVLDEVFKKAPDKAKPAIKKAIDVTNKSED